MPMNTGLKQNVITPLCPTTQSDYKRFFERRSGWFQDSRRITGLLPKAPKAAR